MLNILVNRLLPACK